ncbi:hypothetical protein [Methanoregula sp.]|uniref:hypothetical protein n=1 Tax=Methanoregula sp. TaxID=2052170 RepID=UPI002CB54FA9|nr:hypothetical protein [Methanoregula sp.]HVP96733.1 hypothetical protein [Methanoregula sp.]
MTDFVQTNEIKRSVRTLTAPIEDIATFDSIVASLIANNPLGCVPYMSAGMSHPGMEKTKEAYTVRIIYQDNEANVAGTGTHKFASLAGYTNGAAALLADTALNSAHGGIPAHEMDSDTFSATIKCSDANGEIYNLLLARDKVTLSSYEDESIRTKVEAWADSVPELA